MPPSAANHSHSTTLATSSTGLSFNNEASPDCVALMLQLSALPRPANLAEELFTELVRLLEQLIAAIQAERAPAAEFDRWCTQWQQLNTQGLISNVGWGVVRDSWARKLAQWEG